MQGLTIRAIVGKLSMSSNVRIVIFTILATLAVVGLIISAYVLGSRSVTPLVAVNTSTEPAQPSLSPSQSPVANVSTANANSNQATARLAMTPKPVIKKRTKESGAEYGWKYWTETNDSPGGYYYFYQPATISKDGDRATAWLRRYTMYPAAYGKKNGLSSAVNYVLERVIFDCENDTYRVSDETYFDMDGSSIPHLSGYSVFHELAPGTTLQSMKFIVCLDAIAK